MAEITIREFFVRDTTLIVSDAEAQELTSNLRYPDELGDKVSEMLPAPPKGCEAYDFWKVLR